MISSGVETNGQVRETRASVDNRPIRVEGQFGCLYSPVKGADWLDVLSVGGGPVGKDVWIGYIGDGFSQYQSSDAAPLTELQYLNTSWGGGGGFFISTVIVLQDST